LLDAALVVKTRGFYGPLHCNSMKVAILIHHFLPEWIGGMELATFNIAEELVVRGHNVHVITSRNKGLLSEVVESGIHIHRIRWPNLKFIGSLIFSLKTALTLSRVNPQIIQSQSISMGSTGLISKWVLNRPYIVWGRGSEVYLPHQFKKLTTRIVLGNADAVIALTDDMKQEIQRLWPGEISVIPNGINLKKFERISRESARRELEIEQGDKVVLFVGTLRQIKGADYLVTAMQYILRAEPRSRLILVGDGAERQKLEHLVSDLHLSARVSFVGKIQNEQIPTFMIASDVFVLPSLSEGLPVVVLEALAAALPIVATSVGGVPSIVADGINGFLIKSRDVGQIADKVLLLLSDPELRHRMSENNKKEAQQYTWNNVVDELEKIYWTCLKDA